MRVRWQRVLRAVLGLFAIGFAIAVYLAIRERQPAPGRDAAAPRTDPAAVAESTRGVLLMARGAQQDFRVEYERLRTYADGTLRLEGVKALVPQREGRDFEVVGERATVTNQQQDVTIEGNVSMTATDGLVAKSESATYQSADATLRVPGAVTFSRGRLQGSGTGASYERTRDVLTVLEQAHIVIAPDPETNAGALDVRSEAATFARTDRYLQFDRAVQMVRDTTTVTAAGAVAHLAPDEDRLTLLELRGGARVAGTAGAPGGLESMAARDMNLEYAADGRTLRRATLAGAAEIHLAGPAGQAARRLSAESMDISFSEDGTQVTSLAARDRVELVIPGGDAVPLRQIRAASLDGAGDATGGLRSVRFVDDVEFREEAAATGARGAISRVARSRTLDAQLQPGLGALDRAAFGGGVTLVDGTTELAGPDAVYDLLNGMLRITSPAQGAAAATMTDPRVRVAARTLDISLDTKAFTAEGDVRSVLKGGAGQQGDTKRPTMLRSEDPVNVTSRTLVYDAAAAAATYSGEAVLWQGETAIQAGTITLDERQGNLHAATAVRSTWRLDDRDPRTGTVEPRTSVATAETFVYEEAERRATYTTAARLNGPEGDLQATRIELYLDDTGRQLDRLEAYEAVRLQSAARAAAGDRLTYYAAEARYVVHGTPVRVLEQLPSECRETAGRTLTFFRSTDTIHVNSSEQERTQTTTGGPCAAPAGRK